MKRGIGILLVGGLAGLSLATPTDPSWKLAEPGYHWSFPKDYGPHRDYKSEWWYFTGHLTTTDQPPRHFGYQFTLFRLGITRRPVGNHSQWQSGDALLAHAALTDLDHAKHFFADSFTREAPFLGQTQPIPKKPLAWLVGPAGSSGTWAVNWDESGFSFNAQTPDFAFELKTHPLKPLVYQGPEGLSRKTSDGSAASLYYSFTRLATAGTVTLPGASASTVIGQSWMDKEFGSGQLGAQQVGWDWFSLQLNDGREIMLYLLRNKDNQVDYAHGTLIDSSGHARYLKANQFSVQTTAHWESPLTHSHYPAAWTIQLTEPPMSLEVKPEVQDQENRGQRLPDVAYWEGAVQVKDSQGHPLGVGYVELTGYSQTLKSLYFVP
jgi:predicted secreted hydrolase